MEVKEHLVDVQARVKTLVRVQSAADARWSIPSVLRGAYAMRKLLSSEVHGVEDLGVAVPPAGAEPLHATAFLHAVEHSVEARLCVRASSLPGALRIGRQTMEDIHRFDEVIQSPQSKEAPVLAYHEEGLGMS